MNIKIKKCQLFTSTYTPMASADQIDLSRYKILINEPLHDILNHIKNIQEKLSHHVHKDNKIHVKNIIASSFRWIETQIQQITEKFCWLIHTDLLKTLKSISLPIFWYHFLWNTRNSILTWQIGHHIHYYP